MCHRARAAPGSGAMTVGMRLRGPGNFDYEWYIDDLKQTVRRHAAFRTSFHALGSSFEARVHEGIADDVELIDARNWSDGEATEQASKVVTEPFVLTEPRLFRYRVFARSPYEQILVVACHHAVCDGASMSQLVFEAAIKEGGGEIEESSASKVAEYAHWEQELLRSREAERRIAYWHRTLPQPLPSLDGVPSGAKAARGTGQTSATKGHTLGHDGLARLRVLGSRVGAGVHSIIAAAYAGLLGERGSANTIVLSSALDLRRVIPVDAAVGPFFDYLPLVIDIGGAQSVERLVKSIADAKRMAILNYYPAAALTEALHLGPLSEGLPFAAMLNVLPMQGDFAPFMMAELGAMYKIGSLEFHSLPLNPSVVPFEGWKVALLAGQSAAGLLLKLAYTAASFSPAEMEGLAVRLVAILDEFGRQPDAPFKSVLEGAL